jgi:hypothetical protein
MKTYYIEIGIDGQRNFTNFVVLASEFSEALNKAGIFIEVESRKKEYKGCEFSIVEISLNDDIREIKRISGKYVDPTFK